MGFDLNAGLMPHSWQCVPSFQVAFQQFRGS